MPKSTNETLFNHDFSKDIEGSNPTFPVTFPKNVTIGGKVYKLFRCEDLPRKIKGEKNYIAKPVATPDYSYFVIDETEPLAEGGSGKVYKAYLLVKDTDLGKLLADSSTGKISVDPKTGKPIVNPKTGKVDKAWIVKVSRIEKINDGLLMLVAHEEAVKLNQHYVTKAPVFSEDSVATQSYIFTESVGENDLYQYLEKRDPADPARLYDFPDRLKTASFTERIELIKDICLLLTDFYNHTISTGRAMLHRDIKGMNFRIGYNEFSKRLDVYLIDFGGAKHLKPDSDYFENENIFPATRTPLHQGPEYFKGHQGIFTDIYALTAVFLAIFGVKNPLRSKISTKRCIGSIGGEKAASKVKYVFDDLFSGFAFPIFAFNLNIKNYIKKFLERMQGPFESRPKIDEVSHFFVALCNLNEINTRYQKEADAKEKKYLKDKIYICTAKLALLSENLWKFGKQKITDNSQPKDFLPNAVIGRETFEHFDLDEHPQFCTDITTLSQKNRLNTEFINSPRAQDILFKQSVLSKFVASGNLDLKNLIFENSVLEYDEDHCLVRHLKMNKTFEYYWVDKTKKVSLDSENVFAAQLIDIKTGQLLPSKIGPFEVAVTLTKTEIIINHPRKFKTFKKAPASSKAEEGDENVAVDVKDYEEEVITEITVENKINCNFIIYHPEHRNEDFSKLTLKQKLELLKNIFMSRESKTIADHTLYTEIVNSLITAIATELKQVTNYKKEHIYKSDCIWHFFTKRREDCSTQINKQKGAELLTNTLKLIIYHPEEIDLTIDGFFSGDNSDARAALQGGHLAEKAQEFLTLLQICHENRKTGDKVVAPTSDFVPF